MKLKYLSSAFLMAAMMISSCSDSNKWEPGVPEGETMGVYFKNLDNYDILILDDEDRSATIRLGRVESDAEAIVPLKVLSCPEGVTVPESVRFEAGSESASFTIDMKDMPLSSTGMVTVQIDPAYSSQYAAGTSVMNLKVTVSGGWQVIADDLILDYTENTYQYPQQHLELYILDGTKRFKIPNLMYSGIDFIFTVDDPEASRPLIVPYTNCKWFAELFPTTEDTYHCWYFYDTATATYPEWSPDGVSPAIVDLMFYGYDDSSTYSYINFKSGYGYLSSATTYDNGKYGYGDLELYFTPKYNPFAE